MSAIPKPNSNSRIKQANVNIREKEILALNPSSMNNSM
jgi:hypothetical protein